ncbi:MAG: shikimate kinase [Candidatus Izemoplasmatales bacterium]|nr:shikimate kinase [Candidatus Izemoplasmatales bacterium]
MVPVMYGLIGRQLTHSFSPYVHSLFGNAQYRIIELDDISAFLNHKSFRGINVTIPYKEAVIPFLGAIDPLAERIGSVNTIINENGLLKGYNTDYQGLKLSLEYHKISIENKKVLIVGNGGAAKTVALLARDLHADRVVKACRSVRETNEYPLQDINRFHDFEIIINTTPIGMYPHNSDTPLFSLKPFTHLTCVMDLIYNPLKTKWLLEAESLNIPAYNGLYMLVAQAKGSHDRFFHKETPLSELNKNYNKLRAKMTNLVFVGLPMSGKSLYARRLEPLFRKHYIDTDREIEKNAGISIVDIFRTQGEKAFRKLEFDLIKNVYRSHNQIISTGGGMIMNSELMDLLKQNGLIIYLDKDPAEILKHQIRNRPLMQNADDLYRLAEIRGPLYQKHADITFKLTGDITVHIQEVERKINEYFSHKRTQH